MIVTRLWSMFALVVSWGLLPPVEATRGAVADLAGVAATIGAGAWAGAATTGAGGALGAVIMLQAGVRKPATMAIRQARVSRDLFMEGEMRGEVDAPLDVTALPELRRFGLKDRNEQATVGMRLKQTQKWKEMDGDFPGGAATPGRRKRDRGIAPPVARKHIRPRHLVLSKARNLSLAAMRPLLFSGTT